MKSSLYKLIVLSGILLLSACTIKYTPEITSDDLSNYKTAYIDNVSIKSEDPDQDDLDTNKELEEFTIDRLKFVINQSGYKLIDKADGIKQNALAFSTTADVDHGNAALRFLIGLGAGKGTMDVDFMVKEAKTGIIKFKLPANFSVTNTLFAKKYWKWDIEDVVYQYPVFAQKVALEKK